MAGSGGPWSTFPSFDWNGAEGFGKRRFDCFSSVFFDTFTNNRFVLPCLFDRWIWVESVSSFSIHLLTIVLSCLADSTGGFGWRGMSSDVGRVSRNRGRKWGFDCDNIGCGDSALAIETMVSSGGGDCCTTVVCFVLFCFVIFLF